MEKFHFPDKKNSFFYDLKNNFPKYNDIRAIIFLPEFLFRRGQEGHETHIVMSAVLFGVQN